jgi:hypothetical protein
MELPLTKLWYRLLPAKTYHFVNIRCEFFLNVAGSVASRKCKQTVEMTGSLLTKAELELGVATGRSITGTRR